MEISKESSLLADFATSRQEMMYQFGFDVPLFDSEFDQVSLLDSNYHAEYDGEKLESLTLDSFTRSDADDFADDECADDNLEIYGDQYITQKLNTPCSPRDSQVSALSAQQCYNCPDCKKVKNRLSGSSDSGNVSDDSKGVSSCESFTDSAISSLSSTQDTVIKRQEIEKPSLWKTESTESESDIFASREVYAKQLRKNSRIIRSASVRKQVAGVSISMLKKQQIPTNQESRIIETLV
jgi:hypothetical protein